MKRFLCLGLIFGMVLWGGSAWALSIAETVCYLDWNSLSITADYQWEGNQYTYLRAEANNDFDNDGGSPAEYFNVWGDYSQTANVFYAAGIAETYRSYDDGGGVDQIYASTYAEADGTETTAAGATANVRRSGDIMVLADTQDPITLTLDFSIDYYIYHDLYATDLGDDANVYTEMHFTLGDDNPDSQDSIIIDQATGLDDPFGTLTFSATIDSGVLYGLEADIYTTVNAYSPAQTAPVPEPSTMVLMGLGLVGLAGYGRKRLKT